MEKPNPTNGELALMIESLKKAVEVGFCQVDNSFKGVHARQDHTNGTVRDNADFVIKQQTQNKFMYGVLTLLILPTMFLVIQYILNI